MREFADTEGRTWTIEVNVSSIKRVRSLLQVDLLQAVGGELMQELISDPIKLCDIIFCLCKPQADALKLSDEDFGRAMAGDPIGDATAAFLEELVEFFPLPRRQLLGKALIKLNALEAQALQFINQKLDSPELERELQEQLEVAMRGAAGN